MSTQIMSLSTYIISAWLKYCYPNHIGILILLKVFIGCDTTLKSSILQ